MSDDFEFNLTKPILYKSKNSAEQEEAFKLILSAPTNKQRTQRIRLKQFIKQAADSSEQKLVKALSPEAFEIMLKMGQEQNAEAKAKEARTPEEIEAEGNNFVDQIYSCSEIKAEAVIEEFLVLLQEVCLVEGDSKLTKPLFDKMTPGDTDRLLGAYIANFISGS